MMYSQVGGQSQALPASTDQQSALRMGQAQTWGSSSSEIKSTKHSLVIFFCEAFISEAGNTEIIFFVVVRRKCTEFGTCSDIHLS